MRYLVLSLILIGLSAWGPDSAAQQVNILPEDEANILTEPNVLATGDDGWPIEVTVPETEVTPTTRAGSLLALCASRLGKWPKPIEEACQELILEAVRAQRQRLQALAEFPSNVNSDALRFRFEHTKATLEEQRAQGTRVFRLVVAVIIIGLLAAVAQFIRSFYLRGDSGSAEIAISNNEFKFRTTWLGVLLLGMSMGFLFLYLVYVYPVRFVGS
jgi:uncharacterized membrane protein